MFIAEKMFPLNGQPWTYKSTNTLANTLHETDVETLQAKKAIKDAVPERERLSQVLLTLSSNRHSAVSKKCFSLHLLLPDSNEKRDCHTLPNTLAIIVSLVLSFVHPSY